MYYQLKCQIPLSFFVFSDENAQLVLRVIVIPKTVYYISRLQFVFTLCFSNSDVFQYVYPYGDSR